MLYLQKTVHIVFKNIHGLEIKGWSEILHVNFKQNSKND